MSETTEQVHVVTDLPAPETKIGLFSKKYLLVGAAAAAAGIALVAFAEKYRTQSTETEAVADETDFDVPTDSPTE